MADTDFRLAGVGTTVWLFTPLTHAAREWWAANVNDGPTWGGAWAPIRGA